LLIKLKEVMKIITDQFQIQIKLLASNKYNNLQ
jgi:hypothetical protein